MKKPMNSNDTMAPGSAEMYMHKGFIWTAKDARTHMPVAGMRQLFAFNRNDAIARFRREYGKAFDTVGYYLTGDSFSQWGR